MDWDDIRPAPRRTQASLGDNLETLSIAELEARIAAFRDEIARIEAELEKKRRHEATAAALFGKPAAGDQR